MCVIDHSGRSPKAIMYQGTNFCWASSSWPRNYSCKSNLGHSEAQCLLFYWIHISLYCFLSSTTYKEKKMWNEAHVCLCQIVRPCQSLKIRGMRAAFLCIMSNSMRIFVRFISGDKVERVIQSAFDFVFLGSHANSRMLTIGTQFYSFRRWMNRCHFEHL